MGSTGKGEIGGYQITMVPRADRSYSKIQQRPSARIKHVLHKRPLYSSDKSVIFQQRPSLVSKSQYPKPDPESPTLHERPHSFSDTEAFF